jgi:hypothetical protein
LVTLDAEGILPEETRQSVVGGMSNDASRLQSTDWAASALLREPERQSIATDVRSAIVNFDDLIVQLDEEYEGDRPADSYLEDNFRTIEKHRELFAGDDEALAALSHYENALQNLEWELADRYGQSEEPDPDLFSEYRPVRQVAGGERDIFDDVDD